MNRQLTAIIEREGNGYVALCPEVGVASQGEGGGGGARKFGRGAQAVLRDRTCRGNRSSSGNSAGHATKGNLPKVCFVILAWARYVKGCDEETVRRVRQSY